MTKLERTKQKTREKWQGILADLPNMADLNLPYVTFKVLMQKVLDRKNCGFCQEYNPEDTDCQDVCPVIGTCRIMDDKFSIIRYNFFTDKLCSELALSELCQWALFEIEKVEDNL